MRKREHRFSCSVIDRSNHKTKASQAQKGSHKPFSAPDPESFLSSDTCPETPDGSLKEEVDSPDTGSYVCLWDNCNEEFETQKLFVDHLNDAHTETKKGCDEFPCMWKVRFSCSIETDPSSINSPNRYLLGVTSVSSCTCLVSTVWHDLVGVSSIVSYLL